MHFPFVGRLRGSYLPIKCSVFTMHIDLVTLQPTAHPLVQYISSNALKVELPYPLALQIVKRVTKRLDIRDDISLNF